MEIVPKSINPQNVQHHGKQQLSKSPTLQEVKVATESSGAYTEIFPEMFKLLNIIMALFVGTATVERTFSQLKIIKTRLHNRISDVNLIRLMRIAIEGPELVSVNFDKIQE